MHMTKYLGLFSSVGSGLLSANGDGELGLSRSLPKSTFNKSGRFLLPLPDRALLAQERSEDYKLSFSSILIGPR